MRLTTTVCTLLAAATPLVACTSAGGDEEDAAADAAPSGKSDASGFRTGPFLNNGVDWEGKEPLAAFFYENGEMDFTQSSGDYEARYHQGEYKVYKYAGRDRLRLTDKDGTVLLRTDWSTDADGNLVLGEETFWQPRHLAEEIIDCVTMYVADSNVFEEGLSVEEYPNVSLEMEGTGYSVDFGASSFDSTEAKVTVEKSPTDVTVTATLPDGYAYGMRVPHEAPRRGEVFHIAETGALPSHVANISCR